MIDKDKWGFIFDCSATVAVSLAILSLVVMGIIFVGKSMNIHFEREAKITYQTRCVQEQRESLVDQILALEDK